jgi:uncharacterized protein (UPF0332 family)
MDSPHGSNRTIVNRAYYAAFYALLALLLTKNEKPRKHIGAISILDKEFVKSGLLGKEASNCIHELFDMRMEDDYVSYEPVSREEAEKAMSMSEKFVCVAREYLLREGYLAAGGER